MSELQSPHLERYHREKARIERLRRRELEGSLVRVDRLLLELEPVLGTLKRKQATRVRAAVRAAVGSRETEVTA